MDDDEMEPESKLILTETVKQTSALSSLLSNDSGFKSENQTASSSSPSSSGELASQSQAQSQELKQQMSRSSEESVPIMVDCHSTAAAVTSSVNDINKQEDAQHVGIASCEIKPIPIKKSFADFADEEKNLADGSFRFKPTGAVFKSISNNQKTSTNLPGNFIYSYYRYFAFS